MEDDFRHKIIIDPVHGDIGLSELETNLINTPTFQRLKRIKQLGFAHTVYPGARHTRFEHSLGVMHIMSRIIQVFRSRNKDSVSDDHYRKLRIAALLHDIGHYPYSHLMEKIPWDSARQYISKKGQAQEDVEPPKKYPSHEKLGEIIITERKDIKELLESNGIDLMDIAALIQGSHEDIPNLLNASLDVDRLDYLVRDSQMTGLPYGRVDLNYIVNNLELDEKEIVVRPKAKSSVEHMLMGRYFMFNTVYTHKTVFAFEELIRKIVLILWNKGKIYKSGEEIENVAKEDSEKFLEFDDRYLDKLIDKYANDQRKRTLANFCKSVKFRKPPKLVYEISELRWDNSPPSQRYTIFKTNRADKIKELAKDVEINVPEEYWLFADIKTAQFEKVHPFMSLAEVKKLLETGDQDQVLRELVKLKDRSGNPANLIEDPSSIFHYLSRLNPTLCRLYVLGIDDAKANLIHKKIDEWLKELIG